MVIFRFSIVMLNYQRVIFPSFVAKKGSRVAGRSRRSRPTSRLAVHLRLSQSCLCPSLAPKKEHPGFGWWIFSLRIGIMVLTCSVQPWRCSAPKSWKGCKFLKFAKSGMSKCTPFIIIIIIMINNIIIIMKIKLMLSSHSTYCWEGVANFDPSWR